MALDNAEKFVRMIREDKALTERMKGLTLAEGIAAGAEMGLDLTEDELTEAEKHTYRWMPVSWPVSPADGVRATAAIQP